MKKPQTVKRKQSYPFFLRFMIAILMMVQMFVNGYAEPETASHVRVLLTSFQSQNQLRIDVYGSYTMDQHISFQRGSQLAVSVVDSQLQVSYEGMVYLAGTRLKLVRHQSEPEQENGLRLQGQLNLYPGDLHLSVQDNRILPIMTVPIEEYLIGVVPFEMADEFPLEALKAQAIAARTYTLANLKPTDTHDLVDNTNDQVYRGLNPTKVNAIRAIKETEGLVCMYAGELARCFYTASNGGLTESAYNAWGRESIPYLTIQKDQYDLENPASIQRSAQINKNPQTDVNLQTDLVLAYLDEKVKPRLADLHFNPETDTYTISKIIDITPHTAKHGGELGVMKFLRFDLNVVVENSSAAELDSEINLSELSPDAAFQYSSVGRQTVANSLSHAISIDCPIFPEIEKLLSLSINLSENEIVHVIDRETSFSIQFSRYGHGVGMSQRGAEWMAGQYQWNYQQILRFYYPGTEIVKLNTTAAELDRIDLRYFTTPGPVPTATPRPTLMPQSQIPDAQHKIVYVTGVSQNSSLNLRAQPDYLAEIITRLYFGQQLLVVKEFEDGWLEVKTDAVSGFVRNEFVSQNQP